MCVLVPGDGLAPCQCCPSLVSQVPWDRLHTVENVWMDNVVWVEICSQHIIYTISVLLKPYNELYIAVNVGIVILQKNTPIRMEMFPYR